MLYLRAGWENEGSVEANANMRTLHALLKSTELASSSGLLGCRAWCRVCRKQGMRLLLLTACHAKLSACKPNIHTMHCV